MCRFACCAILCLASGLVTLSLQAADDPVAMVIDLVTNDDAAFREIGLDRIRHAAKGEAATAKFAALLVKLPPVRQGDLLRALADRGDKAAIPGITVQAIQSPDATVRAAAIAALGVLGGGSEVAILKKSLAADEPEKSAAQRALIELRSDDADAQILAAAKTGDAALRPALIDILANRRTRSALADLVAMTSDADPAVRAAAMRACGALGGPAEVPGMIAGLSAAASGDARQRAERAVVMVCTKNPGHEEATKRFLEKFKASSEAEQESLLPVLGGIGGPAALAIVDDLIASSDAAKRQLGLKAITRWPDATVASRLLDLVAKAKDPAERDLLVGTLIRIAPLPDNKLNDKQKLELVQKTMGLCENDEDRARLIERANAIRTIETFRYVMSFLDTPTLAEPACKSVVELAHHRQLRDANKDEFMKALDRVISTTKNAELVERANAYKEGKTWERKKG